MRSRRGCQLQNRTKWTRVFGGESEWLLRKRFAGLVQRIQRAHALRRSRRVLHTSQKQSVFCVHFCQLYALLRNLNE
ncbi:hypothetical protein PC128_g9397 [Phytophthora cactorum]|nr:hypothetical protein PC128_g9397 [Phytophthora cactorum]